MEPSYLEAHMNQITTSAFRGAVTASGAGNAVIIKKLKLAYSF